MTSQNRNVVESLVAMAIGMAVMIGLALAVYFVTQADARPNPEWQAQRIQAERNGDAQRLRVLDFISKAGTLRYPLDMKDANGNASSYAGTTYHRSCCGQADAYEADDLVVIDGALWATLTCNDPDDCAPIPGKVERAVGSKFKVKASEVLVNEYPINKTGHGWIWISPTVTDDEGNLVIYCYSFPELL